MKATSNNYLWLYQPCSIAQYRVTTKSNTTSKRNSVLSCFLTMQFAFCASILYLCVSFLGFVAFHLTRAPVHLPCTVSCVLQLLSFFFYSALFLFLRRVGCFFFQTIFIVTSSFQFCFSSEIFMYFFLLYFITQILAFRSKFVA